MSARGNGWGNELLGRLASSDAARPSADRGEAIETRSASCRGTLPSRCARRELHGQPVVKLRPRSLDRVWHDVRIASERDLGGSRLVLRGRVTHQHRGDLRRDASRVKPGRCGVTTLVQTDRLKLVPLPSVGSSRGQAARVQQARGCSTTRRTYKTIAGRAALPDPSALEQRQQRSHRRHDAPRSPRLTSLLLDAPLDHPSAEIDIAPAQTLDLRTSSHRIRG